MGFIYLSFTLLQSFFFITHIIPIWVIESPFKFIPLFFWLIVGDFSTSIFSGRARCPKFILHISWSRNESQSFLQGTQIPFSEKLFLDATVWEPRICVAAELLLLIGLFEWIGFGHVSFIPILPVQIKCYRQDNTKGQIGKLDLQESDYTHYQTWLIFLKIQWWQDTGKEWRSAWLPDCAQVLSCFN